MTDDESQVRAALTQMAEGGVFDVDAVVRGAAAGGGRVRRRRRRLGLLGVVAAVVAVIGAGSLVGLGFGAGTGAVHQPAVSVAPSPTARAGTHEVGLGRVVVSVPDAWVTEQPTCGGRSGERYVYFPPVVAGRCPDRGTGVGTSGLQIADTRTPLGRQTLQDADTVETINGLEVRIGQYNEKCFGASCELASLVVPSEHVALVVIGGTDVQGVLDSVRLLPEGYTAVPYLPVGTTYRGAQRALNRVGLTADYPAIPVRPGDLVSEAHAQQASVVPTGTSIMLSPVLVGVGCHRGRCPRGGAGDVIYRDPESGLIVFRAPDGARPDVSRARAVAIADRAGPNASDVRTITPSVTLVRLETGMFTPPDHPAGPTLAWQVHWAGTTPLVIGPTGTDLSSAGLTCESNVFVDASDGDVLHAGQVCR